MKNTIVLLALLAALVVFCQGCSSGYIETSDMSKSFAAKRAKRQAAKQSQSGSDTSSTQ